MSVAAYSMSYVVIVLVIERLTAHSFRHTFATLLAKATGGDQFVLKAT